MPSGRLADIVPSKKISRRDVISFLLSLFLAFGIWVLYNLNKSYSATLVREVSVVSNLPGHFQRSQGAVTIEARCTASGYDMLSSRRSRRVEIGIDKDLFSETPSGEFVIPASSLAAYVGDIFGSQVRLEAFSAPTYTFSFPVENHKKVPVVPVTSLSFKSQYMQRGEVKVEPDSVIVYGEPALLDNLDRIYSSRISHSKLSAPVTGWVPLEKRRGVRLSESHVRYSVDVVRFVEVTRSVPVSIRGVPAGKTLSVYPSTAEVTFRCVFPMAEDRSESVRFWVDYQDFLRSSGGKCAIRSGSLPRGVLDWKASPEVFECVEEDVR